jgi:two-component SAPR family response regulator
MIRHNTGAFLEKSEDTTMLDLKRILVVEDDPTVYPLISRMVHRLNPNVGIDFALSVEGAENILHDSVRKYDVILTDIGLAGSKTGVDLVNEVCFSSVPVPFVLTSANREFKSRLPFLPKPFRYEDFAEKLAPYLDENAPSEEERTGKTQILAPESDRRIEQWAFATLAILGAAFYVLLTTDLVKLPL